MQLSFFNQLLCEMILSFKMAFLCRNPEEEQLYNLVCLSTVSMMQDSATLLPVSPGELKVSGVDAQAICQKLQALYCKKIWHY